MARLRKLKDEDKPGVIFFNDGTSVFSENRVVSTASNVLYFQTSVGASAPHGTRYMTTREGQWAWAVPASLVLGVK